MSLAISRLSLLLFPLLFLPTVSMASPRQLPAGFSPWLLPEGQKVLRLQVSASTATAAFSAEGHLTTLPLDEKLTTQSYGIKMRWGVSQDLELAAETYVRYRQRTGVVYPSNVVGCAEPVSVGANCYDPNTSSQGLGDLWLSARYNLLDLPTTVTVAPVLKLPLFYAGIPEEGALDDGLRLGDGQIDLGVLLLTGQGLSDWPALIRMGIGVLHRFGAPGEQLLVEGKGGYVVQPWLIVTAGAMARVSITEGQDVLKVAPDPTTGTLIGVPSSANEDVGVIEAGILLRGQEGLEVTVAGELTFWGKNTDLNRGINVAGTFFF